MAHMSPIKTARYASLRDEDNCTINEAKVAVQNLLTLGFKPPKMYILNDAVPFDTAITSMEMDQNTPVAVTGYFNDDPSKTFSIAYLVDTQRESNSAWDLYQAARTLLMTDGQLATPKTELIFDYIKANMLEDGLTKLLQSVEITPLPAEQA